MTSYAAFLRGINVGRSARVAMPALRGVAERLGYAGVRTYINSGNLVFASDHGEAAVVSELGESLRIEFGHGIDVVVRSAAELRRVLSENPFPDGDPSRVTVAFLAEQAAPGAAERIAALGDEPFVVAGREVWVHYLNGMGRSRLAAQLGAAVRVRATVRNVRTVGKVVELLP